MQLHNRRSCGTPFWRLTFSISSQREFRYEYAINWSPNSSTAQFMESLQYYSIGHKSLSFIFLVCLFHHPLNLTTLVIMPLRSTAIQKCFETGNVVARERAFSQKPKHQQTCKSANHIGIQFFSGSTKHQLKNINTRIPYCTTDYKY